MPSLSRDELLRFCTWLEEGEFGEGHEEEIVDKYLKEHPDPSLSERMREAADTLVEATKRYYADSHVWLAGGIDPELHDWRPTNLRHVADLFEEEDAKPELTLVVVGYDEMRDWFLVDTKTGKQVPFNCDTASWEQLKDKYGIELSKEEL